MIHIITPTSGNPDAHFTWSLLRAALDLGMAGIKYASGAVIGVTPVDVARNEAVAMFLDGDATHLMFVDDDMIFTARDIVMLRDADKPVIGAMVPKRMRGAHAVTPAKEPVDEGAVVSVDSVGTGFMLIKREVLVAMVGGPDVIASRKPHERYPLFHCGVDADTQTFVSEDYAFCARARKLGFGVWCHTGLRIGHVGKHVFYSELSEEQRRAALLAGARASA